MLFLNTLIAALALSSVQAIIPVPKGFKEDIDIIDLTRFIYRPPLEYIKAKDRCKASKACQKYLDERTRRYNAREKVVQALELDKPDSPALGDYINDRIKLAQVQEELTPFCAELLATKKALQVSDKALKTSANTLYTDLCEAYTF